MYTQANCKRYAMFTFGMNPPASRITFHGVPDKCITGSTIGKDNDLYKYNNPSFAEDVIEFLSNISLTHTIVDVNFSTGYEILFNGEHWYDIWLQPSSTTNIDAELIGSVLKNINKTH